MRPPARTRLALAAVAVAGLALAGCGGDTAPLPVAPAAPPPGIVELHPAPRSTRQPYDVVAWARFEAPLDSSSVSAKTVFLMLDTRRVPVSVRWDAATQRILIVPLEELTLARTHTVQLSAAIRTAEGTPLPSPFEWQFRVTGVRSPDPVYPAPGADFESPFASPDWVATDPAAGDLRYEFYAGPDSAAVAGRSVAPLIVHAHPLYLPTAAWPLGGRVWWSVTTENRSLGERIDGPVSRFDVLPAGTRVDSVGVPILRYGWGFSSGTRSCGTSLWAGSGYTSGLVWSPAQLGGPRRLAGAWLQAATSNPDAVPRLFGAERPFAECAMTYPGPPYIDPAMPELAAAQRLPDRVIRFRSDALTARFERAQRGASAPGFLFRSGLTTNLVATGNLPSLRLYYYVPPPGAPAPAPPTAAVHPPPRP